MSNKLPDTSLELILKRHYDGVKLQKPERFSPMQTTHSLDQIFKLPCNVYFDHYDFVAVNMNELSVKTCGYESAQDIIGRSGLEFFTKETAMRGMCNQLEVMETGKMKILQDTLIRRDDTPYSYISISFPWYSEENHIIGVFGCSFPQHTVAESLIHLYELGLLSKPKKPRTLSASFCKFFSTRETQCIELLLQGKSPKEIGKMLNLSYRTIEHYIANIKDKLEVRTKAELIAKVNEWLASDQM
jgi:DNA-binding CsgD family transcriptional regulator